MARSTPRVESGALLDLEGQADAIALGTPAWYAWLEQATTFAFISEQGSFTARKERSGRSGWYWKAYRKHKGTLHRAYLGKSAELTLERLNAIAADIARRARLPPAREAASVLGPAPAASDDQPAPPTAAQLPQGTLTFCFSDIEGSTQLWQQHPHSMPQALVRHDAILREAIQTHGGVVFKTVGDGVYAVFARAIDALAAALAAQRALHAADWGELGSLRVRMALHTGAAELRHGDYFGGPLNRLARILALGHGNQILLSHATHDLVTDDLPSQTSLRPLGEYSLKDLTRPEPLFQVVSPDLPSEFPPLRAATSGPTPAPAQPLHLLATKLYVPPPRPQLVPRPRLLARLDAGLSAKLTLLCAPAGFGKSTLLSAWRATARGRAVPFAWVSLDAADSEPLRFWSYLITALDRIQPDIGAPALALLQAPQPAPIEAVLTPLLNALSTLTTDAVLVLDDYHLIDAVPIHSAVAFLLDHLPPLLHLIIATRADPPLPLTRLRARGQLVELRAADLRFTLDEAAALLNEGMGLTLDQAAIAALEQRTEGWAVGLQLAALALRERGDSASFVRDFSGSHHLVLDFLTEEVLDRQPNHLRHFLLQTAILERLCGPLCDAVLGISTTEDRRPTADGPTTTVVGGQWSVVDSYSQRILTELERAQLFLIPLDDTRTWYRYHQLFGDVLRARLLRGASTPDIRELHGRAAAWYTSQRLWHEALRHALNAQQWDLTAGALEQIGEELMLQEAVDKLRQLIQALPEALRTTRPRLLLYQGLCELRSRNLAAAQVLLAQAADGADATGDLALQGEALLHLSDSQRTGGDFAAAYTSLQAALAAPLLPRARVNALIGRAYEALVAGDWRASSAVLDEALELVLASADRWLWLELAINVHSLLLVLPGRTEWAERLVRAELPWPEPSLSPLRAALRWIDGYIHLLRGDLAEAATGLEQALRMHAELGGANKLRLDAGIQQMIVTALHGDLAGADRQLTALLALLNQPELAVYAQVWGALYHYFHGWLWVQQGRLDEAQVIVAGTAGASPAEWPTAACSRLLLRGLVALEAGELAGAEELLRSAAREQARFADAYIMGEARLPLALAALRAGRTDDALASLRAALDEQVQRGTPGVLLLVGAAVAVPLLRLAQTHGVHPALAKRLLGALGAAPVAAATPPTTADPDALTGREVEVLHLLARGASNQAIAATLVVSLPTAKTHVARILAKLGAANRTEAVALARERRLI